MEVLTGPKEMVGGKVTREPPTLASPKTDFHLWHLQAPLTEEVEEADSLWWEVMKMMSKYCEFCWSDSRHFKLPVVLI